MKSIINNNEVNAIRAILRAVTDVKYIFIETLSNEFTSKTGVAVYAYLAPMDIKQLFTDYLQQNKTVRDFLLGFV